MFKHLGCGGDLNVFAGDGAVLFVCSKCEETWQVAASSVASKHPPSPAIETRGGSTGFDLSRPPGQADPRYTRHLLRLARDEYPEAFEDS
jgi:hypothetical protein